MTTWQKVSAVLSGMFVGGCALGLVVVLGLWLKLLLKLFLFGWNAI